jgi:peptidoglycan hydrolase CwlO-like protein
MGKCSALFALAFVLAACFIAPAASADSLQNQIDANTQEVAQLNQQIAQYQAELNKAGADKKTLQAAIAALDLQRKKVQTQIAATQKQINTTQLQIAQLGAGIMTAQQSITASQAAIAGEMQTLAEADNEPMIIQLLSSNSLSQAWSDADATVEIQNALQDKVYALQSQEKTLADSKAASQQKNDALTVQQQSLASQQASLAQTTQSKTALLAETAAKESNYEKLLAQAQAELASFSTFAEKAGGSGLLANQTSCDSWGCYYNQRDAAWGADALDGTQYQLKSDGCLITSMAMLLTHYGYRDVTPVTINSNPGNFAAYYPAYLLFTISVDGMTVTRITATIDATLATGNPVVVGLKAYGGTHYVVLVSGSKGSYLMRDPYIPNGKDISFSAHYALKNIFGIAKITITG